MVVDGRYWLLWLEVTGVLHRSCHVTDAAILLTARTGSNCSRRQCRGGGCGCGGRWALRTESPNAFTGGHGQWRSPPRVLLGRVYAAAGGVVLRAGRLLSHRSPLPS
uniref:Secreted protein n=1 Tax=Plectus sambesii TaxID=2011161 RepID=A0A914UZT7_9BILA